MGYLIAKIILCLLAAAILGFIIGWLLKKRQMEKEIDLLKSQASDAGNNGSDKIIAGLQADLANCKKNTAALEKSIYGLEAKNKEYVAELDSNKSKIAAFTAQAGAGAIQYDEKDDLKEIFGIAKVLEDRLNEIGIHTFREIATFTEEDIERVAEQIGPFRGRIRRDHWITQAKSLHKEKYGEKL